MINAIKGLFSGKIVPWERPSSTGEKHTKMLEALEAEMEYFKSILSTKDWQRLQEFTELHTQLLSDEEESAMVYSFSLGALLMLDIEKQAEQMILS